MTKYKCKATNPNNINAACQLLEHYHTHHTDHGITRFFAHDENLDDADIYIVTGIDARKKFYALANEIDDLAERTRPLPQKVIQ